MMVHTIAGATMKPARRFPLGTFEFVLNVCYWVAVVAIGSYLFDAIHRYSIGYALLACFFGLSLFLVTSRR